MNTRVGIILNIIVVGVGFIVFVGVWTCSPDVPIVVVMEVSLNEVNCKLTMGNDTAVALKIKSLEVLNHTQVRGLVPRLVCDVGLLS